MVTIVAIVLKGECQDFWVAFMIGGCWVWRLDQIIKSFSEELIADGREVECNDNKDFLGKVDVSRKRMGSHAICSSRYIARARLKFIEIFLRKTVITVQTWKKTMEEGSFKEKKKFAASKIRIALMITDL